MFFEVPTDLAEALRKIAEANDRTMQAEAIDAMRRHVAQPPRVVVVKPDLPESVVERGEAPKKRPGRKPKRRGG